MPFCEKRKVDRINLEWEESSRFTCSWEVLAAYRSRIRTQTKPWLATFRVWDLGQVDLSKPFCVPSCRIWITLPRPGLGRAWAHARATHSPRSAVNCFQHCSISSLDSSVCSFHSHLRIFANALSSAQNVFHFSLSLWLTLQWSSLRIPPILQRSFPVLDLGQSRTYRSCNLNNYLWTAY